MTAVEFYRKGTDETVQSLLNSGFFSSLPERGLDKMSAIPSPVNNQLAFRRREFETLLSENQRRWETPQPVHGAGQTATQQQHHRVNQNSTS